MTAQLPDEVFRLIGRIVVAAAATDYTMARIAEELLGGRASWTAAVAGQSYTQLDQMLRAICRVMEESSSSALIRLLDELKPLHGRRDIVAHGTWVPTDIRAYLEGRDSDEHMAVKPRRWKDALSGEKFTSKTLTKLAEDLEFKAAQLGKFQQDYLALIRWNPEV